MIDKGRLQALGIPDDKITQLLDEISRENGEQAKQAEGLRETVKNYESQLASLKQFEGDNAALKTKVQELEASNKKKAAEYEAGLTGYKRQTAARIALMGREQKPHDIDLALSLLDLNKIELDDNGKIKAGLREQLEQLEKDKPFLFAAKQPTQPPTPSGLKPFAPDQGAPEQGKKESIGESLAKRIIEQRKRADFTGGRK